MTISSRTTIASLLCVYMMNSSLVHAADKPDTLKKVRDSQTITLGVRDASVPFSYLDDQQVYRGYSIDLCMKIVDAVKKQLKLNNLGIKYVAVTPATRIQAIEDGKIDMECGSTTNNMERQKQVAFAPTTFVSGTRILSKKSAKIRSMADLIGKSVVSTEGTPALNQISTLNNDRNFEMKIIKAKDHKDAFQILEKNEAAGFFMDEVLLASLAATSKNPNDYELVKQVFSVEPYGIAFHRDDPAFDQLVNKAITDVMQSGEIKTIYARWFQSPLPGKNINLNLPMNEHLAAVITLPTNSGDPAKYAAVPDAQKAILKSKP
jgi:glutamate/aspartate transport system substrate-binding protein